MSDRTGFRCRVAPSARFARHLARCMHANSHSLVFWRPSPSPCSLCSPFSPSLSFCLCLSPAMSAAAERLPPNALSLLPTLSLLRSYGTRRRSPPFTPSHLSPLLGCLHCHGCCHRQGGRDRRWHAWPGRLRAAAAWVKSGAGASAITPARLSGHRVVVGRPLAGRSRRPPCLFWFWKETRDFTLK